MAPPSFQPVDHQAEGLERPPLIALRLTANQLTGARRKVRRLEEVRRTQIERALSFGIPATSVAKAAGISRTRLYKAFPDEVAGARETRREGPPALDGGTGSKAPR